MLLSVRRSLENFRPTEAGQETLRRSYLAAVDGEAMLWKGLAPEHVTASCFVFSPAGDEVLLSYHRKGQFWVQFGGHLERADASLAAAALREAREESGISDLELTGGVVDLDRHELHGGFTCSVHWDIGFTALADPDSAVAVSSESEAVAWWPVSALPDNAPADLPHRVARAAQSLRV